MHVGLINYWVVVFLMMTGFYIVMSSRNLIKKMVGLGLFQTSVFILYITMGKMEGGTAPILTEAGRRLTPIPCPTSSSSQPSSSASPRRPWAWPSSSASRRPTAPWRRTRFHAADAG